MLGVAIFFRGPCWILVKGRACWIQSPFGTFPMWLWVNGLPSDSEHVQMAVGQKQGTTWKSGKWNHGLKYAAPWCFSLAAHAHVENALPGRPVCSLRLGRGWNSKRRAGMPSLWCVRPFLGVSPPQNKWGCFPLLKNHQSCVPSKKDEPPPCVCVCS